MSHLIGAGATLAVLGAAHAAVNARMLRRPTPGARPRSRVSVLVPARNEAARIAGCIRDLLAQDVAEILVLDDESADGTGDIARAAAGDEARVRVIRGTPPPDGWLGKPHACAQLAATADPDSTVLVFLDADVRTEPGAIRAAVALLEATGLDLISPHPRQIAVSAAERLVQPLLQWSILTTLPVRIAERSPRPALAAANGQFLIVRREAYERAGGHAAVRDAILDDLALLRAIKRSGGRGAVVDGSGLASCRMYDGWRHLRDGYGRSLWAAFGSAPGATAVVGALAAVYVVPAVAALRGSRVGFVGYAAGVAGRVISARATRGRAWPEALAHPLSITLFGYLTARSLTLHRLGRLTWKDRPVTP